MIKIFLVILSVLSVNAFSKMSEIPFEIHGEPPDSRTKEDQIFDGLVEVIKEAEAKREGSAENS